MTNILLVTSSLMADKSLSNRTAADLVAALRKANPAATLVERHLTPANAPHLSADTFMAAITPADKRTAEQNDLARLADEAIAQVEAADAIVIAAPMYNFSIPSTLKAWIDHIARAGRTFRYTDKGPVGQLTGKKVYVVVSRGGQYVGSPMDFQETYLRAVLGFIGLTDVTFVRIESQAMGAEPAAQGVAAAKAQLADLIAELGRAPSAAAA